MSVSWDEVAVLIPVPDTQLLTVSVVSLGSLVEGLAGGASLEEAVDNAGSDGPGPGQARGADPEGQRRRRILGGIVTERA